MSRMGVYDQIRKAFQDLIAPELHAIRGDIRVLDQKIDDLDVRLSTKIDSLRTETISLKDRGQANGSSTRTPLTLKSDVFRVTTVKP